MDRIFTIKCLDLDCTLKITGTTFEQIKSKIVSKLFSKYGGIGYTTIRVSYSTLNGQNFFTTDIEIRRG